MELDKYSISSLFSGTLSFLCSILAPYNSFETGYMYQKY